MSEVSCGPLCGFIRISERSRCLIRREDSRSATFGSEMLLEEPIMHQAPTLQIRQITRPGKTSVEQLHSCKNLFLYHAEVFSQAGKTALQNLVRETIAQRTVSGVT